MSKLAIKPNANGYRVKRPNNDVLSVSLAGGASRQRLDRLGTPSIVSVSWMADEYGYQYLTAFFNTAVKQGSLTFLCDLVLDKPYLTEHVCRYVPGTFSLDSTIAFVFNCSAQFEVLPQAIDSDFDTDYIAAYELYGSNMDIIFNLLNELANVALANNLD
jgi:hypothetical protein